MKKSVLTACLMGIFSGSTYAVPTPKNSVITAKNQQEMMFTNPFFAETKLELSFKNYWKYLKEDAANPKEVHSAWGQGLILDYKSGYFADFIGIDATYYGALKLAASDYFNTRGVLYNNGSGNHKSNAKGYNKLGQRFVKLKANLSDMQFNARGGWQILRNYGVLSTSTRLSPTTYLGWSGSAELDGFTLRGTYTTSSMDRNSPEKKHFQTQTGKDINHITTGDLTYKNNLFTGQYGYGESDDYLRRHIVFLTLKPQSKLTLGSQIYLTKALDDYTSMPLNRRNFDDTAHHYAFDIKWQETDWSAKLGLGYTKAHKGNNELGFYPRHMSKHSRGTFISMAFAGEDYLRDGEKMLAILTDYKISPALTVGIVGNYGQFNYDNVTVRTGEISVFSRWVPDSSYLKNLTLFGMAGTGWSYKNKHKTPILTHGDYSTSHSLSAEFIAEYRFGLL